MKKRILIVCRAFYPDNSPRSFRATELAKEFARQGHSVTVLKPESSFDYSDFVSLHSITIKSFGKLKWGFFLKPKGGCVGALMRKFARLLFLLFDYPTIEIYWRLRAALRMESNYNLMISIAVPHAIHWGIARVRTHAHTIAKTWVADCGDPFMGNTLETIRPPFYFSYFEKAFCRSADFISVPTTESISAYYPEFHSKMVVIPQGFNLREIEVFDGNIRHSVPTFSYAGGVAITGVRSLNRFVEYLLSKKVSFRFHVYSAEGATILDRYRRIAPDRIFLHPKLDRKPLIYELSKMDFLVNLDNGTARNTPSKLIDYSIAKRPILNVYGQSPNGKVIDEFLAGDYSNALPRYDVEQYDIARVSAQFLALDPR